MAEGRVHQGGEPPVSADRDQRRPPTPGDQHGRPNPGRWPEAGRPEAAPGRQVVPGPPADRLRGGGPPGRVPPGRLLLDHQVGPLQPRPRVTEQPPQDRRRRPEGQVGHHPERPPRRRQRPRVRRHHPHVGMAGQPSQRLSEHSGPSPDLDHQIARPDPGLLNQLSRQPAPGKKVLPEVRAPARTPGHGTSPRSWVQRTPDRAVRQANCSGEAGSGSGWCSLPRRSSGPLRSATVSCAGRMTKSRSRLGRRFRSSWIRTQPEA